MGQSNRVRLTWRAMRWLALIIVLGCALTFWVGLPTAYVYFGTHPARLVATITPAARGLIYETVSFAAADGVMLSGWYIPSHNHAAVILTHGYSNNRSSMMDQADALARRDFGVLMYDLRDHGASAEATSTRGWLEVNDVLGAVAYLRTRRDVDPDRIGAFGFSIGGQATLRAAAQTTQIRAVAADGPSTCTFADEAPPITFEDWLDYPAVWVYYKALGILTGAAEPLPVIDVVAHIAPRPLLLISTGMGPEHRVARRYYEIAGMPKTLWEIPEAGHGGGFAARPNEYTNKLTTFFSDALLGPSF